MIFVAITAGLLIFSVSMFLHYYMDARKSRESFEELVEIIAGTPDVSKMGDTKELERERAMKKYGPLFKRNNDYVGWIAIDGTQINYPVMQTPHNPDYYLKRNFHKVYSNYGVPYMEEICKIGISNNIVIYGHHMNDGSMFADLVKYYKEEYRNQHPLIRFDTISDFGTYEVVAAFNFDTDNETFQYNQYVNMDKKMFEEFIKEVNQRRFYDAGVDIRYGDQLLTLSTCEYTYKDGRFVVVAKKVDKI